jgi:carbonic anhydrase
MNSGFQGNCCGTIIFCVDKRVNPELIAKAMKKQGFNAELAFCIKNSYGAENAGNKIHERDLIVAQVLELGLRKGKIVSVFGHKGKCGGMHAQHELHKLEFELREEKRKGNKRKAKKIKNKINELKKNAIIKWVSFDIKKFSSFVFELKKIYGKDFKKFLFSDEFRQLLEEFNVFLQLSKLIKRNDFLLYSKKALKEKREITLVAGIYFPKENSLNEFSRVGRVDFDFPLMYSILGEKNVKKLLSSLNLKHSRGNPVITYFL